MITRPNLPCVTVGLEIFQRQKLYAVKKGWLDMEDMEERGQGDSNGTVIKILIQINSLKNARSEEKDNKASDSRENVHPG